MWTAPNCCTGSDVCPLIVVDLLARHNIVMNIISLIYWLALLTPTNGRRQCCLHDQYCVYEYDSSDIPDRYNYVGTSGGCEYFESVYTTLHKTSGQWIISSDLDDDLSSSDTDLYICSQEKLDDCMEGTWSYKSTTYTSIRSSMYAQHYAGECPTPNATLTVI
eukprot:35702_1